MKEANITINGRLLTTGQAMTIRVAIESFAMDLSNDGLGEDAHGKMMAKLYLERISEIRQIL